MFILVFLLLLIILLKYSKNELEHFCGCGGDNEGGYLSSFLSNKPKSSCLPKNSIIMSNKQTDSNSLKMINEYNRNNMPVYLKQEVYKNLNKHVFSRYKFIAVPIDIDFLKVSQYPGRVNHYVEVFVLNKTDYTTNKFIVDYNILLGGKFQLRNIRVFNFKDNTRENHSRLYKNIYGIDRDTIISNKNLTNPFVDNSINPGIYQINNSKLETTELGDEFRQLADSKNKKTNSIDDYNQYILPEHIPDKNLYMTMTPDFFNINVYPVEIDTDIFSRTRQIPSFPTGHAV